jgi:DNA-binding response OmpR family regulator
MSQKILVVEDDREMVDLLRFNLKRAGFSVATAFSGVEALKKVCSIRPDLILLDLTLPELDGFVVCEVLRQDSLTRSIPIVILTALTSQFARLTGLEAGASDFVTKPFSPKELIARIQRLLRG